MFNEQAPNPNLNRPMIYQIRIKGHLDNRWAGWFENASMKFTEEGVTIITCPAIDQAALHGLLKKIRDLGLTLLSINCIEPN